MKEFSNDTKVTSLCENNKNPEYRINIGIKNPVIVLKIKSFLITNLFCFFLVQIFI